MTYIINRRKAFRTVVSDYVAFYKFRDNLDDETGNHNGTPSNITYSNVGGLPSSGKYGIFNGTTSYGQVIDHADITDLKSVFSWIYLNGWGESDAGRITAKNNLATMFQVVGGAGDRISFFKTFSTTEGQWSSPVSSIALSGWYHVGYTYPQDDNVATNPLLYINGSSVGVTEISTPVGNMTSDTGADLYIGNNPAGDRAYNGRQDNLRLYNRVVSAPEVLAIYNSEKP